MNVAIIGTVGIPASYGGFETLVEHLTLNKTNPDLHYTVYCSSQQYPEKLATHNGAALRYVPLKANGIQSIPYDIISLLKACQNHDAILVLGVSGCAFLPIFRLFSKKKLIINIDGLEHRRDKWKPWVRRFLKFSERMAVRHADIIIADNKGIADYAAEEYGIKPEVIAYGGDHVLTSGLNAAESRKIVESYGLSPDNYDMALCRIEPENNVEAILKAYSKTPSRQLAFIGNWSNSLWGADLKKRYSSFPNLHLFPAIYDPKVIDALRRNCKVYLHGHSAGGTNPSLVEAMFFGKNIIAFDCVYNRETTEGRALYFKDAADLASIISRNDLISDSMAAELQEIAQRRYRWSVITDQYEALLK